MTTVNCDEYDAAGIVAAACQDPATTIDYSHTAFIIISMGLVNLMTPGLAFFYGGLVREKNLISIMMQSYVAMGIVTILWFVVAFSLCFGDASKFVGDPTTFAFFKDVGTKPLAHDGVLFVEGIPGLAFAGYQGMFAVITPALMTGAFADRMNFGPYIIFIAAWLLLVYCPVCHWVWGPAGWLKEWGVLDFAGGLVVHTTAGFGALASVFFVGNRKVKDGETAADLDRPHNIPHVALGTGLLWFGWFGFNAGSALGATDVAALAAVNTEISASVALFTWICIDWARGLKPSMVGLCVGAVAGLATITPAAAFVRPWAAAVIGLVAAFFCYACVEFRKWANWDDALDVWGVHGMGGFIGSILIGVLGETNGADASGALFGKQLAAAALVAAYSFVLSFGLLKLISLATPVVADDADGLDMHLHGEVAYYYAKKYAKASMTDADEVIKPDQLEMGVVDDEVKVKDLDTKVIDSTGSTTTDDASSTTGV